MTSVATRDIVPFVAACCVITGIYTDWPDCFGMSGKYQLTCLDVEYKCLKFGGGVRHRLVTFHHPKFFAYCRFIQYIVCLLRFEQQQL